MAHQLETLILYRLPDDYFNTVVPGVSAVTADDVLRVSKKYLDLGHVQLIIVGDRSKIEKPLRDTPAGKNLTVLQFDDDFRLVPAK